MYIHIGIYIKMESTDRQTIYGYDNRKFINMYDCAPIFTATIIIYLSMLLLFDLIVCMCPGVIKLI